MIGRNWICRGVRLALSLALAAGGATLMVGGGTAAAASLVKVASIPIPGVTAGNFDISWYDAAANQYYLADRASGGVDVVNAATDTFVTTYGKGLFAKNGPNGVLREGDRIWAGDGNSTVKVFNATTGALLKVISTGGKHRADEMAYDPVDHVLIVGNSSEPKPFLSFISTTSYKILGTIDYADAASQGIEQPQYVASTGMFVMAIPSTTANPGGEVDEISPTTMKVVAVWPEANNCQSNGLTIGPDGQALLGCHQPVGLEVINVTDGHEVGMVANAGACDEVWYNSGDNQYYCAGSGWKVNGTPSPSLFAVDASTLKLLATVPTAPGAHSVAASSRNNQVFVPSKKPAEINVYAWSTAAAVLPKTGSSPLIPLLGGLLILCGVALGIRTLRPRRRPV
jgi:hypothetical protein